MTGILSTNILSPLGLDSAQNYSAVKEGRSALRSFRGWGGVPGQHCLGVFPEDMREALSVDGFTWFESLVIRSVKDAATSAGLDLSSERLGFILSTTKGNVENLGMEPAQDDNYSAPGECAGKIARHLGIVTPPIVVCNACISGVTAQVFAARLIRAGIYDRVVVCGADTVNAFCLAGFGSFKALSPEPCRPFDIERMGLNIGEGAATMILSGCDADNAGGTGWSLQSYFLNNDAYHISAPSPSGEGVLRAIRGTLTEEKRQSLATVCVHGTATMFNDQMEAMALGDAGLQDVPLTALKPYYGHTMGAAGIIEPVIAMMAAAEGVVLPVPGFEECGVSRPVNVSSAARSTSGHGLLKIISGFGGCNGAAYYSTRPVESAGIPAKGEFTAVRRVRISPEGVELDGRSLPLNAKGNALLDETYRTAGISPNPRFFKMDPFSRLVYDAAALLLEDGAAGEAPESIAMILFNGSSSVVADRRHLATFLGAEGFFPSPSVFVNTLPNVVMGELAAKYGIKGETSFIILPRRDQQLMDTLVDASLDASLQSAVITGWVDCDAEGSFEADLILMKKN